MQLTEENIKWATRKLSRFVGWQDFPRDLDGITQRARSFLRLVHNKPMAEIMAEARASKGLPLVEIDWPAKGIDPEQIDADWILDTIQENMDRFPLPVHMREMYCAVLPPASTFSAPTTE